MASTLLWNDSFETNTATPGLNQLGAVDFSRQLDGVNASWIHEKNLTATTFKSEEAKFNIDCFRLSLQRWMAGDYCYYTRAVALEPSSPWIRVNMLCMATFSALIPSCKLTDNTYYICKKGTKMPRMSFDLVDWTYYLDKADYTEALPDDSSKIKVWVKATSDNFSMDLGTPFVNKFYPSFDKTSSNMTLYYAPGVSCGTSPSALPGAYDHNDDYSDTQGSHTGLVVILVILGLLALLGIRCFFWHCKRSQLCRTPLVLALSNPRPTSAWPPPVQSRIVQSTSVQPASVEVEVELEPEMKAGARQFQVQATTSPPAPSSVISVSAQATRAPRSAVQGDSSTVGSTSAAYSGKQNPAVNTTQSEPSKMSFIFITTPRDGDSF